MRNYVIDTSRGLAAAGVFLAAVVHLDLWVQGFRSIATIGPLFMLNFVGGMIIGVGALVWRHWLPGLAAFRWQRRPEQYDADMRIVDRVGDPQIGSTEAERNSAASEAWVS